MTEKLAPEQYASLCQLLAEWISAVLHVDFMEQHRPVEILQKVSFGERFFASLSDGVVLCELAHKVQPGIVPKIHGAIGRVVKEAYRRRENVSFFAAALTELRVFQNASRRFVDSEVVACQAQVPLILCMTDLAMISLRAKANGLPQFDATKKVKVTKHDVAMAQRVVDSHTARQFAAKAQKTTSITPDQRIYIYMSFVRSFVLNN